MRSSSRLTCGFRATSACRRRGCPHQLNSVQFVCREQGFILLLRPRYWARSIVMSMSVCLSVCQCLSVHDHISGTVCPIFTNFLMPVTYGGGSVLLWRRSDMLCTAGFVDNVISAHKLTGCSTSPLGWGSEAHKQPWAWRVGIPVAGSGRSGLLLAVTAY